MSRFPSIALALFVAGTACASSTPRPDAALREACARDPKADARCVDVLTGGEAREAREEVLDREAARQGDDFQSRLDKLRADEEERQRQRARSSTAAPANDLLAEAERATTTTEEIDSGTSVRAIRPATPEEKRPIRDFADVKLGKGDAVKKPGPRDVLGPKVEPAGPTPEGYLRGAICLLASDVAATKAVAVAARRAPPKTRPSEADLGRLGLVLVDAEGELASVRDELAHRGLPEQKTDAAASPNCTTTPVAEVVELLRSLVGPPVASAADADRYQRGLGRLRSELELRAGLPKGK
ncbi:hypothetical protein L6R52_09250 [Myxococcota bacterium]|nr:hypothetical protein [Myxococcota bacterium]